MTDEMEKMEDETKKAWVTQARVPMGAMKLPKLTTPGTTIQIRTTNEPVTILHPDGTPLGTMEPRQAVTLVALPKEPGPTSKADDPVEMRWVGEVSAPFGAR